MRLKTIVMLGLALAALSLLGAAPAGAKDGDILRVGDCTAGSTSKIKLSPENGRIEVEFEVDQNRNGVRWNVTIRRNGSRVARLQRTTRPPSGSFEARIVAAAGGTFRARATSPAGEVCTARATWS